MVDCRKRGGLFGCLFAIGIIVLIVYGNAHWSHNASPTSASAPTPSPHLTSAQHVSAAEKAVAMWLEDQGKDPFKRRVGTVDTAKEELAAIDQTDLTPVERIRYRRALAGFRPMYAVVLVARFADHGLDVNVGIEGADKTTVRVKYVGWSRMMIDDLEKVRVIDRHEMRTYGFHQVILTPTVDQDEYRLNLEVAR